MNQKLLLNIATNTRLFNFRQFEGICNKLEVKGDPKEILQDLADEKIIKTVKKKQGFIRNLARQYIPFEEDEIFYKLSNYGALYIKENFLEDEKVTPRELKLRRGKTGTEFIIDYLFEYIKTELWLTFDAVIFTPLIEKKFFYLPTYYDIDFFLADQPLGYVDDILFFLDITREENIKLFKEETNAKIALVVPFESKTNSKLALADYVVYYSEGIGLLMEENVRRGLVDEEQHEEQQSNS